MIDLATSSFFIGSFSILVMSDLIWASTFIDDFSREVDLICSVFKFFFSVFWFFGCSSSLCNGLNASILKIHISKASLGLGWTLNFEYALTEISYKSWQNSSSIFCDKDLIFSSLELCKTFSSEVLCKIEIILFKMLSYSGDNSSIWARSSKADWPLPSIIEWSIDIRWELSIVPNNFFTLSASNKPLPWAMAWSKSVNASLTDPDAASAISSMLSWSKLIFSDSKIIFKWLIRTVPPTVLRFNCRHRDWTVFGSFSGFVVARINTTCFGGSSRFLSKALKLSVVSIWASSSR